MNRLVMASALAIALACGALQMRSVAAQEQPSDLVQNPNIKVDYFEPVNPALFWGEDDPYFVDKYKKARDDYQRLKGIKERLQKRRLLEEFSQFLAPVRFPTTLRLTAKQCDTVNAFFNPGELTLILCYEYIADVEDKAPKETTPQGITRQEAIVGKVVGVLLHEGGHALSHMLQLPVLGREEDTADQIAAFIMVQFGRDVARPLIKGTAYGYNWRARHLFLSPDDTHSSDLQRQHTFLCIAYGKDSAGFQDFVDNGWLPKARAANCENDYKQALMAFRKTVLPHVDLELMKRVQQRKWLQPDDFK